MDVSKQSVEELSVRIQSYLCKIAPKAKPITYQELAEALNLLPPNTIHRVTVTLEHLMQQDASASRPFIAALVISKARGGLPAPGFFECAWRIGRLEGMLSGAEAEAFYRAEFSAAVKFWGNPSNTNV